MRSNTGRPSAVIVFRTLRPSWISVICLEKLRDLSLGPMTLFQPPHLRFYSAALVVPCCRLPGHAPVAADLGNMAIPNGRITRRLQADHCVLWRRYDHIQGLPIPLPQQISCGRSIVGAVSQKARDPGHPADPGGWVRLCCLQRYRGSERRKQSPPLARSSPRWSLRQRRRIPLVLCFCASHSPSPKILRPVLSTTRWIGADPACLIT